MINGIQYWNNIYFCQPAEVRIKAFLSVQKYTVYRPIYFCQFVTHSVIEVLEMSKAWDVLCKLMLPLVWAVTGTPNLSSYFLIIFFQYFKDMKHICSYSSCPSSVLEAGTTFVLCHSIGAHPSQQLWCLVQCFCTLTEHTGRDNIWPWSSQVFTSHRSLLTPCQLWIVYVQGTQKMSYLTLNVYPPCQ